MTIFTRNMKFNVIGKWIKLLCRNHVIGLVVFVLTVPIVFCGCQKTSATTMSTPQGVTVKIIKPNASSKNETASKVEGGKNTQYWKNVTSWAGEKPGQVEVIIDDLRLTVDGQDYGILKSGDNLTVDMMKSRNVTVNNQDRQPEIKKE